MALLGKVVPGNKNCEWNYCIWANPGGPWGGIVPPSPVLVPGSGARIAPPRCPILRPRTFGSPLGTMSGRFLYPRFWLPFGVGGRQLLSPGGVDRVRATTQLVWRSDIGNRALRSHGIEMFHELGEQPRASSKRKGIVLGMYSPFRGLEPAIQPTFASGTVRGRSQISHSTNPDKLSEIPGDEVRAIVRDDPGSLPGIERANRLDDRLNLVFLRGRAFLSEVCTGYSRRGSSKRSRTARRYSCRRSRHASAYEAATAV